MQTEEQAREFLKAGFTPATTATVASTGATAPVAQGVIMDGPEALDRFGAFLRLCEESVVSAATAKVPESCKAHVEALADEIKDAFWAGAFAERGFRDRPADERVNGMNHNLAYTVAEALKHCATMDEDARTFLALEARAAWWHGVRQEQRGHLRFG